MHVTTVEQFKKRVPAAFISRRYWGVVSDMDEAFEKVRDMLGLFLLNPSVSPIDDLEYGVVEWRNILTMVNPKSACFLFVKKSAVPRKIFFSVAAVCLQKPIDPRASDDLLLLAEEGKAADLLSFMASLDKNKLFSGEMDRRN